MIHCAISMVRSILAPKAEIATVMKKVMNANVVTVLASTAVGTLLSVIAASAVAADAAQPGKPSWRNIITKYTGPQKNRPGFVRRYPV